jgi:hypothetical protein
MYRFKSAINIFFDDIKFDSIKKIDGAKEVVLKKMEKRLR